MEKLNRAQKMVNPGASKARVKEAWAPGLLLDPHLSAWLGRGVYTPLPGRHPLWADFPLGRHPLPETATAADGMHSTGIYSCLSDNSVEISSHNKHETQKWPEWFLLPEMFLGFTY